MKGCGGEMSWMIVPKCEIERQEEPNELIGNRGVEMRCFRMTREIKKEKKKNVKKTTLFWVSEEGFAVLVHAGKLWLEAAVSSLEVKSSFPICITGCYGDVMRHCCDATQATGVFDNCRLFTTLEGLKTVTQQLHFFSSLHFSSSGASSFAALRLIYVSALVGGNLWSAVILSWPPCSIRWVI